MNSFDKVVDGRGTGNTVVAGLRAIAGMCMCGLPFSVIPIASVRHWCKAGAEEIERLEAAVKVKDIAIEACASEISKMNGEHADKIVEINANFAEKIAQLEERVRYEQREGDKWFGRCKAAERETEHFKMACAQLRARIGQLMQPAMLAAMLRPQPPIYIGMDFAHPDQRAEVVELKAKLAAITALAKP